MATARRTGTNENISTYGDGTRDYTSLAIWEAATDNDLVTATQSEVLECYDDAVHDDFVTLAGATTNSSYFRIIRPATGQGHDGTPGTGVRFATTSGFRVVDVQEANVHIQDLVLSLSSSSSSNIFGILFSTNGNGVAVGNIVHTVTNTGAGSSIGIGVSGAAADCQIVDNIVFDCEGQGILLGQAVTMACYNNTALNNGTYGIRRTAGTALVINNLCDGNTTADFNGTMTASYNASGDTTASGTGSRTEQTFTFVDADNDDYHLASGDAGAKGFGTDLSADGTFAFDDDIDGDTIVTWSIGADAQVAAVSYPYHAQSMMIGYKRSWS